MTKLIVAFRSVANLPKKKSVGSHAPNIKRHKTGSQVTPELWIRIVELPSCHTLGIWNFEVVPGFLEHSGAQHLTTLSVTIQDFRVSDR
jgi:hypothetical protein